MIAKKMFNSDQFASSPSVNTGKRQTYKTALVDGLWSIWQLVLAVPVLIAIRNTMSLPNAVLPPKAILEVVDSRPTQRAAAPRPRLHSKLSMPSRIAVIGNYLPRHCGIATFTTDLCNAISAEYGSARLLALPVNDTEEGYDYPARVRWSLDQDDVKSYQEAAEFTNSTTSTSGLPAGHRRISAVQRHCPHSWRLREDARCDNVAHSSARAGFQSTDGHGRDRGTLRPPHCHEPIVVQFLQEIFKVPGSKIDMVPHGVPDLPFLDPNFYKDRFGVEGKAVLLTFGLLSPNKGIENVIQALPQILSKHKNVAYIVAGATHPHILRREGDKYRASLQALAKRVGIAGTIFP